MTAAEKMLCARSLAGGVYVSTLAPFVSDGKLDHGSVSWISRKLASIDGIKGLAVSTTIRERETLSIEEQLFLVEHTKIGLSQNQLMIACAGNLDQQTENFVAECRNLGADAIITFVEDHSIESGYEKVDALSLPVIMALSQTGSRKASISTKIASIAQGCENIVGFEAGNADDVVQYDKDYYALKSIDRPVAVLTGSEGALFHNLNTGGDGVLSNLAFVAPHEVVQLYQATRDGRFFDAQAVHLKLAPLLAILNDHHGPNREMIYRHAAHMRGILPTPSARSINEELPKETLNSLQSILVDIALNPI